MATDLLIKTVNVHKSFKDVKAVQGIDLNIEKGQFVALLGPNGAGKTTMVEMIEGIQHPDSGEILIKNMSWKKNEKEIYKILGISLQETKFNDKLTTFETLKLFASFYNLNNDRVEEILKLINLEDKRKAYMVNLSGGQRQRLALGIALINKPQILILDEPTTGLDPAARHEIWNILKELKDEGNTSMLLTTHYMEEAEILCDKIIIMDGGKILAQGTLEELLKANNSTEIIEFVLNGNIENTSHPIFSNIKHFHWDEKDRKGIIHVNNIAAFLPELLSYFKEVQVELKTIICRQMTLDDLFIAMTGKHIAT